MSELKTKIVIDGDAQQAVSEFDRARSAFDKLSANLKNQIDKIGAFEGLTKETYDLETAFKAADARARTLRDELVAQESPSKALQKAYRDAASEAGQLKTALDRKRAALAESSAALKAAGLDVVDLKAKHGALKAALSEASAAFAAFTRVANARDALGVKPFADIRAEIEQLKKSYETLARSGKASTAELLQAKAHLIEKTRALEAQTNGWVASLDAVKGRAAVALGGLAAELAALGAGWQKNAALAERMAEVFTLFDGPRAQIDQLRQGVEQLARHMGIDAVAAARGLYDVISSGVPPENALTVLEKASRAAVAGVSDTATAVKVGLGVINAYGLEISALDRVYNVLFQTVKDGVTTFPELAQALGPVLPVARAAGVGFEEVAAAIATMTKAGIATPQAVTALRGALVQLSAPTDEAKQALRALGIEWNGLVGTLEQIKGKKLGADAMRALVPDVEGRTAVLALSQAMDQLKKSLEGMENASGTLDAAYRKMEETPEAAMRRLREEFAAVQRSAGEVADSALKPLAQGLTQLFGAFNNLPQPVKTLAIEVTALGVAFASLAAAWRVLAPTLLTLAGSLSGIGAAAGGAAVGVRALGMAFKGIVLIEVLTHLKSIGEWLGETAGRLIHGKIAAVDFGKSTQTAGQEAAEGMRAAEAATGELAMRLDALGNNAGLVSLSTAARHLVEDFDGLKLKGESTADAIKKVFEKAELASPAGIKTLADAMEALRASSRATDAELKNGLEKRLGELSGTTLNAFAISARAAFAEGEEGARGLALVLDAVLKKAIAASGQDFTALTTGIGKGMQDALAHVDLLAENIESLKAMGVDTGRAIEGALVAAFKKVGNATEFDAVIGKLAGLGLEAGRSGHEIEAAMAAAKKRVEDVTPGVNSVAEAFRALGMKSKEELEKTASTAKEAYETIKTSGKASTLELREAFKKYAEAAIEANGGVASGAIRSEAAMRGMAVEVDSAGKAMVKLKEGAKEAEKGVDGVAKAADEVAKATTTVKREVNAFEVDNAALAKQLGLTGAEAEAFARKFSDVLPDAMQTARSGAQDAISAFSTGWDQAEQAAKKYAESVGYVNDLTERLGKASQGSAEGLSAIIAEAEKAAGGVEGLGDQELSGLRSALESAKQQMESLKDSAESTLSSLQEELAQMNGNYAEAERLRYEARRADLEAQLAVAQAQGNAAAASALSSAISTLDQIAARKISEARQREADELSRAGQTSSQASQAAAAVSVAAGQVAGAVSAVAGVVASAAQVAQSAAQAAASVSMMPGGGGRGGPWSGGLPVSAGEGSRGEGGRGEAGGESRRPEGGGGESRRPEGGGSETRRAESGGGSGNRRAPSTINIHFNGAHDLSDRAALDSFSRKLAPVLRDLTRRMK